MERSLIDLRRILEIMASCKQDITVHVEVVALDHGDEDRLMTDHANFLEDFLERVAQVLPPALGITRRRELRKFGVDEFQRP